jgi:hypothetical protein
MTMTTPPRPRSRGRGWDAIGKPVPGDVISCLEELGIDFKITLDEAIALCPMHLKRTGKKDNHPSWSVRIEDSDRGIPAGTHNCLSCGYSGNFVQLVADVLDVDWSEAVRWVRARGGIDRARMLLAKDRHHDPAMPDTTKQINEASLALYVPPPPEALASRQLTARACEELGILWDAEKSLWILPIRDPDTYKLIGWQEKGGGWVRNRPVNVRKSSTLFGIDAFDVRWRDLAILVESPLDVARLRSMEIDEGLSSFGAAVSDAQMRLILDRTDRLMLGLDNDRDGMKYSEIMRKMYAPRIQMDFLNYEHTTAKDIGEMSDSGINKSIRTATSSIITRFK